MIPSRRNLALLWVWAAAALAASIWDQLFWAWAGLGAALGLLLAVDLLLVLRRSPVVPSRKLAASLALGVENKVTVRFQNRSGRHQRVVVHDLVPTQFQTIDLPYATRVPATGWAEITYRLRPTERGAFTFSRVEYRLASPMGLWLRKLRGGRPQEVRVYPNFRAVAKYAMLATDNRLSDLGIKKRQRRGQGTEFHQLREYQVGDSLRQIDWRATSRLRKVISREYRDERDQQMVFLLDCGRRMHAKDGDLTHLDHSLNAVLLLAYVALRQGDAVGISTFGGVERAMAPRKGTSYLNALLNLLYDVRSTTDAADVYHAVTGVLHDINKRSLIVVVSNLRDERDDELVAALRLAKRRHLVLMASLRERVLGEALEQRPYDFPTALRWAATHDYLRGRDEAHRRLTQAGVLHMDVEPQSLAVGLVNKYLDIKASGAL